MELLLIYLCYFSVCGYLRWWSSVPQVSEEWKQSHLAKCHLIDQEFSARQQDGPTSPKGEPKVVNGGNSQTQSSGEENGEPGEPAEALQAAPELINAQTEDTKL